jgi:hypothetical protein
MSGWLGEPIGDLANGRGLLGSPSPVEVARERPGVAEAHGEAWAGRKSRAGHGRVATLFVDTSGAQLLGWP